MQKEMPDSVGRLHMICNKAVQCVENLWAALLFNSSYFSGKKGLLNTSGQGTLMLKTLTQLFLRCLYTPQIRMAKLIASEIIS